MARLMRGARDVRKGVLAFFGKNLRRYIEQAEMEWNDVVVRPNRMEAYEAVSFEHEDACIISISIGQSSSFTTVDIDQTGARMYRPDYDVQVYTWCLAGYDDDGNTIDTARVTALSQRDDIASVIRAMILDNPALGQPEAFELIESTLIEEYSTGEATPNSSGRYIAGVVHNFTLRVDEALIHIPDGYVNKVYVDADKLLEDQE